MSEVEFEPQRPRLFIPNFLSLNECRELEFIHKSSSTVGYRPNVFSTTLSHLIATNSSHFIVPFIPIRERLKDKLEEFFKCEYELFIEFTGLISWSRGASIGWHSDDNRPYLKQRHFSAVCYLNTYDKDFSGGLFHFQDGEPKSIVPKAGDVVMYSADDRNIHSVDEITEGERLTLALWFSRDGSHDEDMKLISLLSQHLLHKSMAGSYLPLPASSNMYWFSQDQASDYQFGFNICWARLHVLGYDIHISQDSSSESDVSELLVKPVHLVRGNELLEQEFVNIMHALQVIHFYCWKGSALQNKVSNMDSKVVKVTDVQREKISGLNSVLSNDDDFASRVFCSMPSEENGCICFDWSGIVAAATAWEDYASNLSKQIHLQLPYWRTHESIYSVQLDE
ncbi:Prolyl 3-hydroxylase 1 [Mucuna pruriens]|uniref:procollagen-proline 3-dioxygenase n=1 Tax=Mucuna pruriens TaxID=157652 RepID=A0A371E4K5_MUCPR|nr:Prolyl 3-hydroxylase 1 [Mucuna pruriens]